MSTSSFNNSQATASLNTSGTTTEPVNVRMQDPSYTIGTPLFIREPHAQHVVEDPSTISTLTPKTSSKCNERDVNFAGFGAQFDSK
ncbi:hypothetical protein G7Z17_g2623 [Cylindrodendrum hubeiense]|uniref:Uncharacterized protein n=1 Tax=Cylindrodendrum hubeiense TaxID=595255 RepID=A0A9P5HMU8_9HYPO|nr:hypothetical protein G7Z17_g2623 [Cylindrodendrum hubeiense]